MAVSEGFSGFGSLFKVGNAASPEVFTTVAELFSIQPGALSTNVIDLTHHESPDAHREKLPGLKDTGPFTIQGNYVPDNTTQMNVGTGLLKLWKDRTKFNFKIVLSDALANEWTARGFISNFQLGEIGLDEKVTFAAEITPTAQPVLP